MIGIETRYINATSNRPACIVAFTCNGHRLVRPVDQELSNIRAHFKVAQELISIEFSVSPPSKIMTYGGTKKGYYFCWQQSTIEAIES